MSEAPMLAAVLTVFATVFVAEMFDKTQIMIGLLSAKWSGREVFLPAYAALLTVAGVSTALGAVVSRMVSPPVLKILGGVAFIAMAPFLLMEGEEVGDSGKVGRLAGCYLSVLMAEIGDKTQLSVIILSMCIDALSAFIGASLAFLATTAIAVAAGGAIGDVASSRRREIGLISAGVFVAIGAVMVALGLMEMGVL